MKITSLTKLADELSSEAHFVQSAGVQVEGMEQFWGSVGFDEMLTAMAAGMVRQGVPMSVAENMSSELIGSLREMHKLDGVMDDTIGSWKAAAGKAQECIMRMRQRAADARATGAQGFEV